MTQSAFWGTPARYKKIAIGIAAAVHAYIYIGFTSVKYFVQGENWFHVWQLPLALIFSAIVVATLHYRWMMRLDARYGAGSGWILKNTQVKLPELKPRP